MRIEIENDFHHILRHTFLAPTTEINKYIKIIVNYIIFKQGLYLNTRNVCEPKLKNIYLVGRITINYYLDKPRLISTAFPLFAQKYYYFFFLSYFVLINK